MLSDGSRAATSPAWLLPALLLAALPVTAQEEAPAYLLLRVLDAETGEPVPSAFVHLEALGLGGLTDAEGRVVFREVRSGRWRVSVNHIGYGEREATVAVEAGADREIRLQATPRAVEVAPLRVTITGRSGYLSEVGFYERRALGEGHFLTEEAISARRPRNLGDLLSSSGGAFFRDVSAPCRAVYLDGVPLYTPPTYRRPRYPILGLFPFQVEAVEVYRHGEYPPGYGNYMADLQPGCTVVLLWRERPGTR